MVIPLASAARSMSFLSSTDRRKSRRSLYSLLSITRTPFLTYFLRSSPLRDDRRLYHIILAMSSGNPLVLQHNWVVGGYEYTLSLIHISEPTRLLSISYAVFCLKKKK